jgi:hypothetical protein
VTKSDQPLKVLLQDMPKLVLPMGRGARGKSFFVRWLVERAQSHGREVVVGDADRTNASLSSFFSGVVSPPSADDRDVREWLAHFVERQIEEKFCAVLDLGGGDLILKQVAREFGLVEFLRRNGIMPVVFHLIGPDRDDLSYLRDVERDGILAPPQTALVLNEATVPSHRTPSGAFESEVRGQPIFIEAIKRGATLLRMPRLEPAGDVDARRLTFADAEEGRVKDGQQPLGPWKRQQIAIWRRAMEESFAPVAGWLP